MKSSMNRENTYLNYNILSNLCTHCFITNTMRTIGVLNIFFYNFFLTRVHKKN